MKKIFIIILNFNGGDDILSCLDSLQLIKEPTSWKKEIIVIDNASTDGSVKKIESKYRKIKVLKNKKNLGFAAGNNIGIRYALKRNADAIILLNQDTVVEKTFLEPLLKNPADIVGSVIKFKRGRRWLYDYGGKINWLIGRTSHQESLVYFNSDRLSKKLDFQDPDYISGCAMLIKRSVFEEVGLLDERFFLYFEDADFCLRAKRTGFKIAIEPKSMIFHNLDERERRPLFRVHHLLRSNLIFINRYISFWRRPLAYLYWWVLSIRMLLMRLL